MRGLLSFIGLLLFSKYSFAQINYNMTPGVTPISHNIYTLHMVIFYVCVVIALVVFGMMLYAMVFHRKSRGHRAVNFHEHFALEITWTIIPFVILVLMAIPATAVLRSMNDTAKEDLTIKITGYQWKWNYEYLGKNIKFFSNMNTPLDQLQGKAPKDALYLQTVDHPLVVPIHQKIRFLMTSNDVIHSWWVPALGVKRDALPGYINEAWARINKPGTYYGQCTELCGMNHAFMPIVVIALSEKDFEAWEQQQKNGGQENTSDLTKQWTLDELKERGEKTYSGICAACHQPTGMGMPPTFPALNGSPIVTGPIAGHIDRVMNGKPGTAMQAFKTQLSDTDIAAVITYERNSWDNHAGTVVQPIEIKAARDGKTVEQELAGLKAQPAAKNSSQKSAPTTQTQQAQPTTQTQQAQPTTQTQQAQPTTQTQQAQPTTQTQQAQPTAQTQQAQPAAHPQQNAPAQSQPNSTTPSGSTSS